MYLTTHASAGLLIGIVIQQPAISFTAAFISHFILDAIPHEHKDDLVMDYPEKDGSSPPPKRRVIAFFIDLAIVAAITGFGWWLFRDMGIERIDAFVPLFTGIAGSTIPDFVLITVYQWDNRFLRWYFDINNRIHFIIPHSSIPRKISLSYQIMLSIICIYTAWAMI